MRFSTPLSLLPILLAACAAPAADSEFVYGSRRPEAVAAFHEGWRHILDEGRWTAAERDFRRAAELDEEWVMGAALVARITTDVEEREALLEFIEARTGEVDPDTRLLLDVFVLNIRAANARDRGAALGEDFAAERMSLALTNFDEFVRRHPSEAYMQAECLEWTHAALGAEAALGRLRRDVPSEVRSVPFFASYEALLLAELGRHDEAAARAMAYERALDDPQAPGVPALRSALLELRGDREGALRAAEEALALDPAHLMAERRRDRLAAEL